MLITSSHHLSTRWNVNLFKFVFATLLIIFVQIMSTGFYCVAFYAQDAKYISMSDISYSVAPHPSTTKIYLVGLFYVFFFVTLHTLFLTWCMCIIWPFYVYVCKLFIYIGSYWPHYHIYAFNSYIHYIKLWVLLCIIYTTGITFSCSINRQHVFFFTL